MNQPNQLICLSILITIILFYLNRTQKCLSWRCNRVSRVGRIDRRGRSGRRSCRHSGQVMDARRDVVGVPALKWSPGFDAVAHRRPHAHTHAHGHVHGHVDAHRRKDSAASASVAVVALLVGRGRCGRLVVMVVVMVMGHFAARLRSPAGRWRTVERVLALLTA